MNYRKIYKDALILTSMVSKYDVFYVIATKGEIRVTDIAKALDKKYKTIHNKVVELERQGNIERKEVVRIINNEKTRKLFRLISFCIKNGINYNLLFKDSMLQFLQKAAGKEFFTRKNVKVHGETFNLYVTALAKYGLLLIVSQKPLKCKLLRHHFLTDLFAFFGKKVKFYTATHHTFIPGIRKEFKKYKKLQKIHYTVVQNLEQKGEINFIHASLSLEGNPITLPETQKLIVNKVVPEKYDLVHIQEITHYKTAIDLMIANAKKKVKLDIQLILKYHGIAMAHIHGAGEIRKQNVRIKFNPRFKTCEWRLLPVKLNELIERYKEFEQKKKDISEIIAFAAFFHNEFQRIHPFIDGNSRTSRLLMLHILRSYELPVLDLPLGYSDLYLDLTKRSTKRDDKAFQHLVEEIIFFNLKKINEKLR